MTVGAHASSPARVAHSAAGEAHGRLRLLTWLVLRDAEAARNSPPYCEIAGCESRGFPQERGSHRRRVQYPYARRRTAKADAAHTPDAGSSDKPLPDPLPPYDHSPTPAKTAPAPRGTACRAPRRGRLWPARSSCPQGPYRLRGQGRPSGRRRRRCAAALRPEGLPRSMRGTPRNTAAAKPPPIFPLDTKRIRYQRSACRRSSVL